MLLMSIKAQTTKINRKKISASVSISKNKNKNKHEEATNGPIVKILVGICIKINFIKINLCFLLNFVMSLGSRNST